MTNKARKQAAERRMAEAQARMDAAKSEARSKVAFDAASADWWAAAEDYMQAGGAM